MFNIVGALPKRGPDGPRRRVSTRRVAASKLTRQRIVTVATERLERESPAVFAVRGLARHLGCEPATLYQYVRSKEELLQAAAQEVSTNFLTTVRASAVGPKSPLQSIQDGVNVLLQVAEHAPHLWELLFLDARVSCVGFTTLRELERHFDTLIAQWVTELRPPNRLGSPGAMPMLAVVIGEGTVRACRPRLLGPPLFAAQIVSTALGCVGDKR